MIWFAVAFYGLVGVGFSCKVYDKYHDIPSEVKASPAAEQVARVMMAVFTGMAWGFFFGAWIAQHSIDDTV